MTALLNALGAEISKGSGSSRRILLNGRKAVFDEPHPKPVMGRKMVTALRKYLEKAGVEG